MTRTVSDFLGTSPVAAPTARSDLGAGAAAMLWRNTRDRVRYEAPKGHTFSLYLEGGTGTRRMDAGGLQGFPGAVSVMPEGCDSEWEVSAPFSFVHLYLSEARLRSSFAEAHDCDARRLSLPEVTYAAESALAAPLAALACAAQSGDGLAGQTAVAELVAALAPGPVRLSGGLSARVLRRVEEWTEAHLEQEITLRDMAAVAGLSEFHFHRMFRASRGIAPHRWVQMRRIRRAQSLLAAGTSIAETAAATGFSSQSHLSRVFRAQIGMTPAQYRRAAGRGSQAIQG